MESVRSFAANSSQAACGKRKRLPSSPFVMMKETPSS